MMIHLIWDGWNFVLAVLHQLHLLLTSVGQYWKPVIAITDAPRTMAVAINEETETKEERDGLSAVSSEDDESGRSDEDNRYVGLPRFLLESIVHYNRCRGLHRFPLGSRVRCRGRPDCTGTIVAVSPDGEHPYEVFFDDFYPWIQLVQDDRDGPIELLLPPKAWNSKVCQYIQEDLSRGDGAKVCFGRIRGCSYAVSEVMATRLASFLRGTVAKSVDITFEAGRLPYCDTKALRTLAGSVTNARSITFRCFFELIDQPQLCTILQTLAESDSLNCLRFESCRLLGTPDDIGFQCWANICSITRNFYFHACRFHQVTPLLEESLKQGFQRNKSLNKVSFVDCYPGQIHCFINALRGPASPKELLIEIFEDPFGPQDDNSQGISDSMNALFNSQDQLEKPMLESLSWYFGPDDGMLLLTGCFLQYDFLKELILTYVVQGVGCYLRPWLASTKNLRSLVLEDTFNWDEQDEQHLFDGLRQNRSLKKLSVPLYSTEEVKQMKQLVSAIENTGIHTLILHNSGEFGDSIHLAQQLRDCLIHVHLHELRSLNVEGIFRPRNAQIAKAFLEGLLNGGLMVEEVLWDKSQLPPNTFFPEEEMLMKTNKRIRKLVPAVKQNNGRLPWSVWPVILSSVSPKACGIHKVLHADPTCGGRFQTSDE